MKKRVCVVCGNEYRNFHHQSVTCSPECQHKHRIDYDRERNKKNRDAKRALMPVKVKVVKPKFDHAPIPCICCGNPFTPQNSVQKACSPECGTEHKRISCRDANRVRYQQRHEARLKALGKRHCKTCGREFQPMRSTQIHCGDEECAKRRKAERIRKIDVPKVHSIGLKQQEEIYLKEFKEIIPPPVFLADVIEHAQTHHPTLCAHPGCNRVVRQRALVPVCGEREESEFCWRHRG